MPLMYRLCPLKLCIESKCPSCIECVCPLCIEHVYPRASHVLRVTESVSPNAPITRSKNDPHHDPEDVPM